MTPVEAVGATLPSSTKGHSAMDGIEDRVRVLEQQVKRYRVLNIALAVVLLAWAAFVVWNLLHMESHLSPFPYADGVLRVKGLQVMDDLSTRPVCVLRMEDGGGRIEVFDPHGHPTAGFDGNHGLVVRLGDGLQFPETRPPR